MAEDHQEQGQKWPRAIIDGVCLKRAFRAATVWIQAHSEEINALNVFPVPDGDTGTNMLLTCQAARDEADRAGDTIPEVMRAIAHGSLMGARGNSGVILSQILRGMARSFDNKTFLTAQDMAEALHEGSNTAYKGVIKPVEGTILTVIREAAEKASEIASQTDDLSTMLDEVATGASESVERTPGLLPALRSAGVVDAGGYGLYVIADGLRRFSRGETSVLRARGHRAKLQATEAPEEGFGYDIQFIVHGETLDVDAIRSKIAGMGESTLVVGDEKAIKVHTHAPNPGPVFEYAATLGPLSRIIVENMQAQYQEFLSAMRSKPAQDPTEPVQNLMSGQSTSATELTGISTVVIASGSGFEKLFRSLDATAIVPGGQTMNPSTQQILAAIDAAPTDNVIVLPNNKNIILTAEEARKLSAKSVAVVPTKTVPQGIAALLALNYDAGIEANHKAMEQAAARVLTAEITTAVRASHLDGIDVQKGEVIGLVDGRLVANGQRIEDVVMATLAMMQLSDCELLTFYYGNGVHAEEATILVGLVSQTYPALETEIVEGGQPHYMYVISAE